VFFIIPSLLVFDVYKIIKCSALTDFTIRAVPSTLAFGCGLS
jgi:hypothetical protein